MSSLPLSRKTPLFFFNDTATTEIYTLSLHDALPIYSRRAVDVEFRHAIPMLPSDCCSEQDRKSTRLNSSHANISYAVFCFKKKMLALARERDRQHLAMRVVAHEPARRVLHRQLRAES